MAWRKATVCFDLMRLWIARKEESWQNESWSFILTALFFVQLTLQITLLLFQIYYCKRCVKQSLLDFSSNSTFVCSVVFTWMFTRCSTGFFWVIPRKGDLMSLMCWSSAFNNANLTPDFKGFSKRVTLNKNPENLISLACVSNFLLYHQIRIYANIVFLYIMFCIFYSYN